MKPMAKPLLPPLVQVNDPPPPPNNVVDVLEEGPDTNYGSLCQCNGTITPKGAIFDGLYLKIIPDGQPIPSDQDVHDSPDATIPSSELYGSGPTTTQKAWNRDDSLIANCGLQGNEAGSTLKVVSWSFDFDTTSSSYQYVPDSVTTPFKGLCTDTCTAAPAKKAARKMAAALPAPISVSPADYDGDWLLYSGLTVSNWFYGNLLMRNGKPLRANLLAVAAADVNWSYDLPLPGKGHRNVHRAVGDLTFRSPRVPWRFASSPDNAVIVWQNKLGLPENVVSTERREHPDLITVDPDADILVQVNYHTVMQRSLDGTFSLWVKIVE